ncbi:MAG: hypothetical protein ACI4PF_03870 [Christensenellales bacterium]
MKKIVTYLILIISSAMFMACGKDPAIYYSRNEITINMGYNYVISSSDIQVRNSSSEYEIVSLDENIVEVNGYIVTPKQEGKTTIRIQLIDNNSIKFDIKVIVTNINYAKDVSVLNEKIYININNTNIIYNPLTLNEGCNEVPELTYDSKIIDYDYLSGKITPKALGETSVIVLFRNCNVSFKVYVIDKIFTKSLVVEDCTIVEGYEGKFNFQVFPDNANTFNFFSTSNLINVSSDGSYKSLGVGEATIYCEYTTSLESTPILLSFKCNIIENFSDFEVEIVNVNNGQVSNYYLLESMYRLRIYAEGVSENNIKIIGNISSISNIKTDSSGLYLDFYFKNSGENEIGVEMSFDGVSVVLKHTKTVVVNRLTDIEIKAKWSAYFQSPRDDGKYYLSLENDGLKANYLNFVPYLNDVFVNEELKLYNVTSQGRSEVSSTFRPIDIGEYDFVFQIMGVDIGEITVVVEN